MSQIQRLLEAKQELLEINSSLESKIQELKMDQIRAESAKTVTQKNDKDAKIAELHKMLELEKAKVEGLVKERARNRQTIKNMKLEMEDKIDEFLEKEKEHKN